MFYTVMFNKFGFAQVEASDINEAYYIAEELTNGDITWSKEIEVCEVVNEE